jgi:hypothetical protein
MKTFDIVRRTMGRIFGGIMRGLSDEAGVARSAKRAGPLQVPQPHGRNCESAKAGSFDNSISQLDTVATNNVRETTADIGVDISGAGKTRMELEAAGRRASHDRDCCGCLHDFRSQPLPRCQPGLRRE